MGEDELIVNDELQRAIFLHLAHLKRRKIVSTNKVLRAVRQAMPECSLPTEHLARVITEAAMCLGLVPVFDPKQSSPAYGYGHPAHRPDPSASYVFRRDTSKVLASRPEKRWRVTG